MKTTIAGTRYLGFSTAMLLAQYNKVVALDNILKKVEVFNQVISSIEDKEMEEYL